MVFARRLVVVDAYIRTVIADGARIYGAEGGVIWRQDKGLAGEKLDALTHYEK